MTARENVRCKQAVSDARNAERERNLHRVHEIKEMLKAHSAVIQDAIDEHMEEHDDD